MLAILATILGIISVQVGASLAKSLFSLIGAAPTVMLRTSFAAAILIIVWRPWRAVLNWQNFSAIFLYGACLGIMNFCFYLALERIPLGICVALEFLGPLSVVLLASKQKIDFLWALLAAIGIALILPLHTGDARLNLTGILFALLAGLCWALYIVFGKRLGAMIHGGVAASLGMIVAAFVTLPFGLASLRDDCLTPKVLFIALAVATLSSAIPYSIEMFVMKKIPMKTFGILMSLEPAVAALSGLLFLKEHLSAVQWTAIFCVVIASTGSVNTSQPDQTSADLAKTRSDKPPLEML